MTNTERFIGLIVVIVALVVFLFGLEGRRNR